MPRFANLDGSGPNAGRMVFRWAVLDRLNGRRRRTPPTAAVPAVAPDPALLATAPAPGEPARITWLGHASWLVQLDGASLLIDPVFGERVSYLIPRNVPAPLRPAQLPRIDATLISHSHYDHFDRPSVLAVGAPVVTGTGLGKGLPLPVRDIGWWDAALLPIGAYDPAWLMEKKRMNPEQAVQAFVDLGARRFVAMHWGTVKLTDEPLLEPPERLRSEWARRALPPHRLNIPAIGETLNLGGTV